jgi:hypothetical protein
MENTTRFRLHLVPKPVQKSRIEIFKAAALVPGIWLAQFQTVFTNGNTPPDELKKQISNLQVQA